MSSLLDSALNTRALPIGSMRYIRSDYPGNLSNPEALTKTYLGMLDDQMDKIIDTIMNAKSNVMYFCGAGKDRTGVVSAIILKKLGYSDQIIVDDYMETKDNLMGFLTSYVKEHPEVDINILIPNEKNIKRVLDAL